MNQFKELEQYMAENLKLQEAASLARQGYELLHEAAVIRGVVSESDEFRKMAHENVDIMLDLQSELHNLQKLA